MSDQIALIKRALPQAAGRRTGFTAFRNHCTMTIKSPCIQVCQIDRTRGLCLGCGRSGDEIQNWLQYSEAQRDAVMASLPERLSALGLPASGDRKQAEEMARAQRSGARRRNKRRRRAQATG